MQFNQFQIGLWTKQAIKSGKPIKLLVYVRYIAQTLTFIASLFWVIDAFMALETF